MPPTAAELEEEREKERQKEKEKEKAKEKEKEKEKAASTPPPAPAEPTPAEAQSGEKEASEDPPLPSSKDKEQSPAVWPKRPPEAPSAAKAGADASAAAKASPKMSASLPPPGTVSGKKGEKDSEEATKEDDGEKKEDDGEHGPIVIGSLDQRYVGLVIGKAGETIKSFKKQSGASIEIDQNLPDGLPRVVIYRGSKSQVAQAKKLVENLVQRAKEDEKIKPAAAVAPIGAGMGILGRGESKDGKDAPDKPKATDKAASEDPAKSDAALPPWRRVPKPEDEQQPGQQPAAQRPPGANDLRQRLANRGGAPWMKREKEAEAAPAGSLTGALTGNMSLSMRPAWMNAGKGAEVEETNNAGIDRSVWSEQRYGRSLMLQAKQKILRGKAYEVPAEMMTMTTGVRPKYKPEKEKTEEGGPQDETTKREASATDDHPSSPAPVPEDEPPAAPAAEADSEVAENWEEVADKRKGSKTNGEKTPKKSSQVEAAAAAPAGGLYENLPGDSKDIMKLKKKLREIQKIEDQVNSGEKVEPNQAEKVTKKAGYLEELKLLESISNGS